jgi:hypothetical protein
MVSNGVFWQTGDNRRPRRPLSITIMLRTRAKSAVRIASQAIHDRDLLCRVPSSCDSGFWLRTAL